MKIDTGAIVTATDKNERADENVIALSESSAFSLEERKAYFKKKWRREHIFLFVLLGIALIAAAVLPFVFQKPWLVGFVPLLAVAAYAYQHNKMMIYVEHRLYDG